MCVFFPVGPPETHVFTMENVGPPNRRLKGSPGREPYLTSALFSATRSVACNNSLAEQKSDKKYCVVMSMRKCEL